MRPARTLLSAFLFIQLNAQEGMNIEGHRSTGYLGASISKPLFIGKSYESPDYWRGVHFKSGIFMMKFAWGQQVRSNADSTTQIGKGFILNWGIRFSKPTTREDRMTIGSFAFRPKLDAGMTFAAIPRDTIPEGWGDGPTSFGVHLSPGIIMRASSVYLIASLDCDAMMNVLPFLNKANKPYNLGRGLVVTPTITLAFDNAWELLSPKKRRFTGTTTYTEWVTTGYTYRTTYEREGIYDKTTYWQIERGFYREKSVAYDYVLHKIDPFWGIGPVATFFPQNNRTGATSMFGGVIGAKVSFLKLEAQYLQGKKGLQNGVEDRYIRYAQSGGKAINYTASVNVTETSIKAGLNLANLIYGRNSFISYDDRSKTVGSTFYGFCVYYKYGKMTFNSAPSYTFSGAEQQIDSTFSAHNIESSAATDARRLPGSSTVQGFGISFDMGCVQMSYERLRFSKAPIADGGQVSVSLIFPVQKAVSFLAVRHSVKKRGQRQE